ncbi:hypothetical protein JIN77_13730 [Verrucomicrobiaceae bacterium R5-34]|uniref:Uncharacterized protein n=1 Tax=Oceaniferula flava TaxID=2800421 RepID=A0AAE2SGT2_9BACT|nr:hypothetical protein [Oceaniferula flavus]MBK1831791.1 hypothetical protein [Verrucomicrobiaceae bacterium R5-34]MBK1856116.1 hypothetical protein [Oceaniferula flavus]MBM1137423.1 hypothetical protein [Oceaniferula flavus]
MATGSTVETSQGASDEPPKVTKAPTDSQEPRSSGRRRVRQGGPATESKPNWEQGSGKSSSESEGDKPVMWIVGGSLLGLNVVAVGAWLMFGNNDKTPTSVADPSEEWQPAVSALVPEEKDELSEEEKKEKQEIQKNLDRGNDVLAQADEVVKKFLNVTKVEDFESVVRHPEVTMPKIKAWYEKHPLEPTPVKQVGYGGRVTVKGNMASLALQMEDYTIRQVAMVKGDDGYRVDWESWVAWTEMPWDELFEKRPVEPQTVFVRCSLDTYYNRYFRDDSKWVAIKMTNPGSDRTLYGYADRDDPTLMRLLADVGGHSSAAVLKIRYPEEAVAGDQVIITEHVLNGWVAPEDTEPEE